jgi:hypothetical protein
MFQFTTLSSLVAICCHEPESPKMTKSQHPLHRWGMKPTLSGCD